VVDDGVRLNGGVLLGVGCWVLGGVIGCVGVGMIFWRVIRFDIYLILFLLCFSICYLYI